MASETRQFCTFYVGSLFLAIEVQEVQEVIRYLDMTKVPLAASAVSGLINLRGQIVTAIDLRRRLELPNRPAGRLPMNVVVRTADGAVSLLVDEIGDVVEAPVAQFEPPPETLDGAARSLITGAYKLENGLLLALNTAEALNVTDIPMLAKSA